MAAEAEQGRRTHFRGENGQLKIVVPLHLVPEYVWAQGRGAGVQVQGQAVLHLCELGVQPSPRQVFQFVAEGQVGEQRQQHDQRGTHQTYPQAQAG
ncbi:hypothetical protein D3C80_1824210 [compost metagenome]